MKLNQCLGKTLSCHFAEWFQMEYKAQMKLRWDGSNCDRAIFEMMLLGKAADWNQYLKTLN